VGAFHKVRGFTLVELLIAMAILGMVIGIATYGYSLFMRHWEGQLGRFDATLAQAQRLDLVFAAMENTLPWVVRDQRGNPGFYFLGRDQGLTLVTSRPVFTPDDMGVIRVFREPDANGTWQLVYEEAPLGDELLRDAGQTLPFQHRMVVLRGVLSLEFSYFGWESLEKRMQATESPELGIVPQWVAEYDGLERRQHPQRIAMKLGATQAVVFVTERADVAFRRHLVE
jgi:prepilin-type N-terminal cleavage/methylation domain-containing protein